MASGNFSMFMPLALLIAGAIKRLLSEKFNCYVDNKKDEIVTFSMAIPGTTGTVASIHNRPGKPGWTLIFSMETDGAARFVSADAILE